MNGSILGNNCVAPDHFLLSVRLSPTFTTPLPGQFVMIQESRRSEPLLARPLSVFGFKRHEDHAVLELLFRVAGRGTALLARMKPGDELTILGPLGKGFTLPSRIRHVVFVAGGVGVAPLIYLLHSGLMSAEMGHEIQKNFYLGARSEKLLLCLDQFGDFCKLEICTDDGSRGYHGPVTSLLKDKLNCADPNGEIIKDDDLDRYNPKDTVIYACGPTPMIQALGALLRKQTISCQVSLEERMACGLGACLGCAVAIRGPEGQREYRRVCQDGPVFDLREVLLPSSRGVKGK
jgi:dihydroorotate dehydrogenase electron transfer subunit